MATLTGNSLQREQRIQEIIQGRIEARFVVRLRGEIRRAMNEAAEAISQGNRHNIEGTHKQRVKRILTDLWTQSARSMSEHVLGRSERAAQRVSYMKQLGVEPTQVMDGVMASWIRSIGTEKITQITDTTQADIRGILDRGIREGLPERKIGSLIKSVAATKSASRAQTIARTEVHSAGQASAQASAEAVGLEMVRVWVSSQGERTRDDHRAADGQTVGMNEPFIVGGESLQYPGDPNGSAAQIINCRCAVVFELA